MTNIGHNSSGLGFTVAGGEDVSKEKGCSLGLICPAMCDQTQLSYFLERELMDCNKGKDYLGGKLAID